VTAQSRLGFGRVVRRQAKYKQFNNQYSRILLADDSVLHLAVRHTAPIDRPKNGGRGTYSGGCPNDKQTRAIAEWLLGLSVNMRWGFNGLRAEVLI
jgi:hypothetical protein